MNDAEVNIELRELAAEIEVLEQSPDELNDLNLGDV